MTMPDVNTMAQGAQRPAVGDGEYPDSVKLTQPGEYIYGLVADVRDVNTEHGPRTVLEVDDQQRGRITFWCGNVQLIAGLVDGRNQLGRKVQAGDVVYVRFDGKEQIQGGRTVSNFAINVAAGQAPPQHQPQQVAPPVQQPPVQPQGVPQAPQPGQQWGQPVPQQQWPQQPPVQPQGQQPGGQTVPF